MTIPDRPQASAADPRARLIEALVDALYVGFFDGRKDNLRRDIAAAITATPGLLIVAEDAAREQIATVLFRRIGGTRALKREYADEIITALKAGAVPDVVWSDTPEPLTAATRLGATITIRLDPDGYRDVRVAAHAKGLTVAEFVRQAALRAGATDGE